MSTSSVTLSPRSATSTRSNRRLINTALAAFVALLLGAAVVLALTSAATAHRPICRVLRLGCALATGQAAATRSTAAKSSSTALIYREHGYGQVP
jgi:hypothetical protein